MPRINPNHFNEDAVETQAVREHHRASQHRAIRRSLHRSHTLQAVRPFVCPDCGGDCKSLMADMQASLNGGRQ